MIQIKINSFFPQTNPGHICDLAAGPSSKNGTLQDGSEALFRVGRQWLTSMDLYVGGP